MQYLFYTSPIPVRDLTGAVAKHPSIE